MAKPKWQSKIDQHVAAGGTVGLASFKAGLFGKASRKEVIDYANSKSYKLGEAWKDFAKSSSSGKKKSEPTSLSGQIKAAGTNVTKGELEKIQGSTGASFEKIITKLDEINKQLGAKGQPKAALGAAAANSIIKQTAKDPMASYMTFLKGGYGFGEGKIGKTLQGMVGNQRTVSNNKSGGYTTVGTPGTGLMIGGTQIGPGGQVRVTKQKPARTPVNVAAGGDTDMASPAQPQEDFDFNAYLDSLMQNFGGDTGMPEIPSMPAMESFDPIASDVSTPGPLSFASLGQSYLSDAIRTAFRNQQRSRDYLRGNVNQMSLPPSALLSIGGQLGGFM